VSARPARAGFHADPATLPDLPGAYALALDLRRPARLRPGALGPLALPAGRYFYLGSAYGPGGIRARAGRHFRTAKALRWHIDALTQRARIVGALAVPGGSECALVRRLVERAGVFAPVPGFGSGDCRTCRAHLVRVPDGSGFEDAAVALADRGNH